jgi:hypothetical protein
MLREALTLMGVAMTAAGGLAVEATAHAASSPMVIDTLHGPVMLTGIQAGGDQAGQLLASIGSRPAPVLARSDASPFDACGANSDHCTNARTYELRNAPCTRNCDQISGGDIINVLQPIDYDPNGPYAWWGLTNDVQLSGGGRDDMCVIYADLDADGSPTLVDDRPQGTQEVGSPRALSFTIQAPIPGAETFASTVSWTSYPGRIGSYVSSDFKTFDTAWREEDGNCTNGSQALANGAIWRVANGTPLGWRAGFTVYYRY